MLSPDRPITSKEIPEVAADILGRIRSRSPRVHCITNAVAQNFTANMLLAAGAIPSMTIAPDEVGEFAARADALLINLGTFDADRRAATEIAINAAAQAGKPWLLDPVFVDRSAQRSHYALALIGKRPRAVRLNRAEFTALSGHELDGAALARFADQIGTTVGMTGDTDIVIDGGRLVCIANGHPLMSKVTAMGCASGALVGACLAVESDAWIATAAALLILGVAGQLAGVNAAGPGSLAVAILDQLHGLDQAVLVERARVM